MRRRLPAIALTLLAAACSSDGATDTSQSCDPAVPPLLLAPLEGAVARAQEFGRCLELEGGGGSYLVIPQFAAEGPESTGEQDEGPPPVEFLFGAADAANLDVLASVRAGEGRRAQPRRTAAERFHMMLRRQEAELAARGATSGVAPAVAAPSAVRAQVGTPGADPLPETRTFKVLSNLNGKEFETVTARRTFLGGNIVVYVDREAPTGFNDDDWVKFGNVFNDVLYPINKRAFGDESDIDGNGRVIVLFTPVVNSLTVDEGCDSYVAGFFTGFDLTSTDTTSNRGEIFYSSVPDPAAETGCRLTQEQVSYLTPATFIHELQHMISYNYHVLEPRRRGQRGAEENVWLNEAMSLAAEELGGKYYEQKTPDQLFPDSSQGFLIPNFGYAYDFLQQSTDQSITTFKDFGTLAERGGAWLFLRWLADQKGEAIFKTLAQSTRRGADNVAQAAGESFPTLFGDFVIAVALGGSYPGVSPSSIPARYRMSRDLREIYARLNASQSGEFPRPYPVAFTPLELSGTESGSMPLGTMDFYALQTPAENAPVTLRFSRANRTRLPESTGAQVSIFRLP